MTKEEIADALGVTKTWITTRMKLGDLSPVLLEAVDEGLSTRAAQAINLLPEELHEEYSARAVGQSVSTVSDMVQARLDEINGIDPNPAEDDADVELLDDGDDDLEPLDEDEVQEDADVDVDATSPLQELLESLANGANLSEDDQERFTLLMHSIRWSKVADQQQIVDALQLALSIEIDESDLDDDDDSDLDDDDENVDDDNADVDDIELLDDED
jgi:hypothetical protein